MVIWHDDARHRGGIIDRISRILLIIISADVLNPRFDYCPPELIDLSITNFGAHSPSYVYRMLAEYYNPEDHDLLTHPASPTLGGGGARRWGQVRDGGPREAELRALTSAPRTTRQRRVRVCACSADTVAVRWL
eukprot:COSAG01_NODE_3365_length_6192_cov_3.999179_6_plen_134_part_00